MTGRYLLLLIGEALTIGAFLALVYFGAVCGAVILGG